jgi:hypothetical protein
MKRSAALTRHTPMKRVGQAPRTKPLKRSPRRRLSPAERALAARWFAIVSEPGRCAVCGATENDRGEDGRRKLIVLQGHHVIPQQVMRQLEQRLHLDEGCLVWAPEIGMLVCTGPDSNRCHDRHTLAVKRIPRSCVPADALLVASALNLDRLIERQYPIEPAPLAEESFPELSKHAVEQYGDRLQRPGEDLGLLREELMNLMRAGDISTPPPPWVAPAQERHAYVVVSDAMVLPLVAVGDGWRAVTCLVNRGLNPAERKSRTKARNAKKSRRRAERKTGF